MHEAGIFCTCNVLLVVVAVCAGLTRRYFNVSVLVVRPICLRALPLTIAALPRADLLGAQVGSVVVRFVEVALLLFALLVEILKAVQHSVSLFLVILTCRREKS